MGQAGYVYIIRGKGTNYIKIGKTTNVLKRLQHLQQGVPFALCLLSATLVEDMDSAEQQLHRQYRRYLIRGEWYALPDVLLQEWPSVETIAPLTEQPIYAPVAKEETLGWTARQIIALLHEHGTVAISSLYEAMELNTKKGKGRIRVCLSRLYAAGVVIRDVRGWYTLDTAQIDKNDVRANDAGL